MKSYWGYTEKERSELSREQVCGMLDRELMERGVVRVDAPELLPVEFPEPPKTTVWCIRKQDNHWDQSDIGYLDAESATAALKNAVWLEHEYVGSASTYVVKKESLVVEAKQLISAADWLAVKQQTDEANANKKANDEAIKDYNQSEKCVRDATDGVWEDWRECQSKARRHQKVIDTRVEYIELCDGNESLAETFLEKSFAADEVRAAMKWFDLLCDDVPAACAAADGL